MKITDWLAVYAAVLSTIVFTWNFIQSKPKIRVRLTLGLDAEQGIGVYISAQNLSAHTVHLSSVSILYPYRAIKLQDRLSHFLEFKRLPLRIGWVHSSLPNYGLSHGCPVALAARNAHEIFIPESTLEEIFRDATSRRLMASAQDKLWNNSYSNVLEYPMVKSQTTPKTA